MMNFFSKIIIIFCIFTTSAVSEILKKIEITGNKRISSETIIIFSEVKINDQINKSKLDKVIKNLYQTNFFRNISLNFENQILFLNVEENPIIENLEINGIKKQSLVEFIKGKIQLAEMKSFNEELLAVDLDLINNILKTNGYYFTKISSSKNINSDLNTINLRINIDLGEKAKIKKIIFLGEKIFKDKRLKEVIASEEHKFWKFISNNVYINQELINLDKRLLVSYFKNNGFYDVKVENSFVEFDKNSNFNLIFNIIPGKKYFFNEFNLNLPSDYDTNLFKSITKKFPKLKGDTYSLLKINKLLNEIDKIALSGQYEFINAKIIEKIDGNKINFEINISESEKFYVEKININGNFNTLEEVIRNNLIIDEGDAYNDLLFKKSIQKVKSLNIFKSVNYISSNNDNLSKTIDITVEEKPTGEIFAGAGTGTTGSSLSAGIKENNYLGLGIKLDTNLTLSDDSILGEFKVVNPNFRNSDKSISTTLESSVNDFMSTSGYKTKRTGFSIGSGFEQMSNFFVNLQLSNYYEDLETSSSANAIVRKQEGNYFENLLTYSIKYNRLDQDYQPTDGFINNFSQTLPLYSDDSSFENSFTSSVYHSLNDNLILSAKLYLKSINSLEDNVRISKRVFVPGRLLRGFESGKIGPKDGTQYIGGNYASALNLNSTLPNVFFENESIDFNYFIDFANVWKVDYNSSIDSNKIRSSTGIALNWFSPIGPLTFSYAVPLSEAKTDITEKFRFQIGTSF